MLARENGERRRRRKKKNKRQSKLSSAVWACKIETSGRK